MTAVPQPKPARLPFRLDLRLAAPLIALVALFILGALVNSAFLSTGNLTNVLTRSAFIAIIAVGATFVITAGGLDLSVGAMAAFVSGVMIIAMNWLMREFGAGWGTVVLGMLVGIVVGAAAGLVNGLVITRGRIEAFIVTLGTMGIYRSLVTYLADGGTLSLNTQLRAVYRPVYYEGMLGIPWPLWVLAVVGAVGAMLLYFTRFGRYCFAIGSNEDVARYSAINIDRIKTLTYVLQGVCVAIACLIYVPRLGSASATTGLLWELEAITAVIIGGTALKGGYGRIGGSIIGAVTLALIGNIMNLSNMVSEYLNGAVQGLIIVAAVLLQRSIAARK
ncbi:MAG: ABC transporter permease [Alphaproteobacteria bacterium]|jgi:ribose transport system permease protein|nr:ABC transporter permease [Alphaproteobacteria bacterium]